MYDYKIGDLVLIFAQGDGHYYGDPCYDGMEGVGFDKEFIPIPKTITSIDKRNVGYITVNGSMGSHSSDIVKAWRKNKDENYILVYEQKELIKITLKKQRGLIPVRRDKLWR